METKLSYNKGNIFLNCIVEKHYTHDLILQSHALVRILSGEMKVFHADQTWLLKAGDTVLFPRNELGKAIKYGVDGQPYKAIALYFSQELLQQYYTTHRVIVNPVYTPYFPQFAPHPLLESLFNSLLPYFDLTGELPADIIATKLTEAVTILRVIDPGIDQLLARFEEPGKIDLADFMNRHYTFNLPMEKFSYLTGRSLTTFKKDFKRTFQDTPQKWLTRKRLELAHYEIVEKKRRPSDVYFEVGFENLSHFSFAFKKQFGYNPTGHHIEKIKDAHQI